MAPHNITLFIMLINNISKHLVGLLICSKLRLEAACGCKAILMWKSKIMEKRPQYVVAITIIILMNSIFIKENILQTFSARDLESDLCPTSSGTFTPAHPIHLASIALTRPPTLTSRVHDSLPCLVAATGKRFATTNNRCF
nr:hypothetical protein Iba_chr06bCG17530 [Ipomoea batatas]GMD08300.1 hypothetical protein Iba_chr06cCG15330 [Ipomoea batatas]